MERMSFLFVVLSVTIAETETSLIYCLVYINHLCIAEKNIGFVETSVGKIAVRVDDVNFPSWKLLRRTVRRRTVLKPVSSGHMIYALNSRLTKLILQIGCPANYLSSGEINSNQGALFGNI